MAKQIKKKEDLEILNGLIIVDPLEVKPVRDSGLKDKDGKPLASIDNYDEHPVQAKVIRACKYYQNNGIEFPSPVKEGDILILRDMSREMTSPNPPVVIVDGTQYIYIRHSDIIGIRK